MVSSKERKFNMWVIDRKNLKVIEVPEDYMECAVCLEWRPKEDFMDEGKNYVCRANCKDCYHLPQEEFKKKVLETANYLESLRTNGKLRMIMRSLDLERNIRRNGVSKDEVRKMFDEILSAIPEDAVVDTSLGSIFVEKTFLGKNLFQLKFSDYSN